MSKNRVWLSPCHALAFASGHCVVGEDGRSSKRVLVEVIMRSEDRPLTFSPAGQLLPVPRGEWMSAWSSGPSSPSVQCPHNWRRHQQRRQYLPIRQIDLRRRTGRPCPGPLPAIDTPSFPTSNGSGSSSPWKGRGRINEVCRCWISRQIILRCGEIVQWRWFDKLTMRLVGCTITGIGQRQRCLAPCNQSSSVACRHPG